MANPRTGSPADNQAPRRPSGIPLDAERKARALQIAIPALRAGVPVATIARQANIAPRTLSRYLQHNHNAFHARADYWRTWQIANSPKRTAFWRRTRLERLSLYRELHGLGPNPPQHRKDRRARIDAKSATLHREINGLGPNPSATRKVKRVVD
jgi:hypothetical protein